MGKRQDREEEFQQREMKKWKKKYPLTSFCRHVFDDHLTHIRTLL